MKLVFINHIGENFQGYSYYELLFSESSSDEVTGDDWDAYPANGNPKVPIDFVDLAFICLLPNIYITVISFFSTKHLKKNISKKSLFFLKKLVF